LILETRLLINQNRLDPRKLQKNLLILLRAVVRLIIGDVENVERVAVVLNLRLLMSLMLK
jgi:hypothetical protein